MLKIVKAVCVGQSSATFTAQQGKDRGKELTRYWYQLALADGTYLEVGAKEEKTDVVPLENVMDYDAVLAKEYSLEVGIFKGQKTYRFV